MSFLNVLETTLQKRQLANRAYSRRAFARDVGVSHTVLSRVMRGDRRLTPRTIRRIGGRLRLDLAVIERACVDANADWITQFIRRGSSLASSRALAVQAGVPLDDVNVAIHHLIHTRRLTLESASSWTLHTV